MHRANSVHKKDPASSSNITTAPGRLTRALNRSASHGGVPMSAPIGLQFRAGKRTALWRSDDRAVSYTLKLFRSLQTWQPPQPTFLLQTSTCEPLTDPPR